MYEYLTEEEIESILEEYGDLSEYIKDQVYEYKKETTDFMDGIKYIFFAYLLSKNDNKKFNAKIEKELLAYEKRVNGRARKGYEAVADITRYVNKVETRKSSQTLSNEMLSLLKQFDLDTTSIKQENARYIRFVENYYKRTNKTLKKEYITEKEYLSKKVDQFDKAEKTVAYKNKDGSIRGYHDIASYDSMIYNTNLTNTGVQESIKSCIEFNKDVVYVEPHPFSCPMCQEYQGKFYSLTGLTQVYRSQPIQTYESAVYWNGGGLNHPNCSHIPREADESDEATDLYSTPEWGEKYSAKQKKQSLELKKKRLRNDNKIYERLENYEAIDKNKQKIKKLNQKIREQKKLMVNG